MRNFSTTANHPLLPHKSSFILISQRLLHPEIIMLYGTFLLLVFTPALDKEPKISDFQKN